MIPTLCAAGMSLSTDPEDPIEQCGRCEGHRFTRLMEDGVCSACIREISTISLYQVEEDGIIPISVKMYYDYMKWHFQKELREKVRGTRLIFTPFTPAALHALREYMLVENPALYISPPKQIAGIRGGKKIVWRMLVDDTTHFGSAMNDPARDRFCSGLTGELRSAGYTCWIPPLTFQVTMVRKGGAQYGKCVISSGACLMTEYGWTFAPRVPTGDVLPRIRKWVALATFGIQQDRLRENARRAALPADSPGMLPQLSMLPVSLLQMAFRHAQ